MSDFDKSSAISAGDLTLPDALLGLKLEVEEWEDRSEGDCVESTVTEGSEVE